MIRRISTKPSLGKDTMFRTGKSFICIKIIRTYHMFGLNDITENNKLSEKGSKYWAKGFQIQQV
jgi:hypothetical protein